MARPKRILADFSVYRREYLRNRTGLFFALVFPLILIVIFGAIFAGGGSGPINVYVQNQDGGAASSSFLSALNSTGTIRVVSIPSSANLSQYMLDNSYSEGMIIPSNFSQNFASGSGVNVTVFINPADSSGGIVLGAVSGVINAFNLKRANAPPIIGMQQATIRSESYKYIDFLIPGLIGFSILTSPMFSMVSLSSEYKKTKLFKQLSLTPLTKGEWLTSKIIWYIVLSIISFAIMTAAGVFFFGAHVLISIWILPFLLIGPLFFVALGMLVGTVTKNEESAGVIGNIITFPMMFLAGTFFPVSSMPTYLQAVARVLPLYYIIDGLNAVMIFSNFGEALIDIAILMVISIIAFTLAIRLFKWRED